jgi:hypothetical protein
MRGTKYAVLTLAALLASCGAAADLPDNVPLAGNWSDTMSLVSVATDGAAMSEDDLPPYFPKLGTKNICGEPKLRTNVELREAIDADFLKKCQLGDINISGSRRSLAASCKLPTNGVEASEMTIDLAAVESTDSITMELTINANATAADGEMQSMDITYRRELKRLGDC